MNTHLPLNKLKEFKLLIQGWATFSTSIGWIASEFKIFCLRDFRPQFSLTTPLLLKLAIQISAFSS